MAGHGKKVCPQCGLALPAEARFCYHCGTPQPSTKTIENLDDLDWAQELLPQFSRRFWQRLEERVQLEQQENKTAAYQEEVYQTGFRETVHRRLQQHIDHYVEAGFPATDAARTKAAEELACLLDDLLDFFFVVHTPSLNAVRLPQAILRYQDADWESVNLFQLVMDYLDLQGEGMNFFTDFVTMPIHKLRNAGQAFLQPARDERIFFIADQTLFGSFRDGFAMTENALYWKAPLQPAQSLPYRNIRALEREQDWRLFNGLYFNVNPAINTRMLLLLRKLKRLLTPLK